MICNGDFEQVLTTGQLKLPSDLVPNYLYNRNDTSEYCIPSKFLAGWDLSLTPDIYTYLNIDALPLSYDPNFSTNYNSDFPFSRFWLKQIKKTINEKNNNYFLGLYVGSYSSEDFLDVNNLGIESISQQLNGIKEKVKYKLDLDMNPFATASEVARFYVMFTKEKLCSVGKLNIKSKNDYLLLSNRMDYNITRNNERNYGNEWQHLEFKNLDLYGYNYVYFLANKNDYQDLTGYYYFLDNISLKEMSYSIDKLGLNYNFCDIGTLDIPIKIKKEIDDSDTLLVKLSNKRLDFDTDGKVIIFGKGSKDTTIYFSATYNEDYRINPEYLVDIELESNKNGNLGKEDLTLTINNNDLEVEVYTENYCGEDTLFVYLDITQKSFTSIDEGQVYLYLPKNFNNYFKFNIIENTLDPNVFITTVGQTENLESVYKIYLNNTLAKSIVHGVNEDLKLKIRFAIRKGNLDSTNIIKTVTNLFADGCQKIQYDTIYNNQLRNRLIFNDTTLCSSLDLNYIKNRNLKLIDGPDIDDLTLTKSGKYVVSYITVEDCLVRDTFNLNLTDDFYLESNLSYNDSINRRLRIDDKLYSETDSIRVFNGYTNYKFYPVFSGQNGASGSSISSLAPKNTSTQVKDTFYLKHEYNIIDEKFNKQNSNYQEIILNYPKSDSIVIESISNYFDGCKNRIDSSFKVVYLSDSSNRIYDYQKKERIINIYPNPTDKILNIEYEVLKEGKFSFQIFDLLGRELYSDTKNFKIGSYKKSIDISRFVNGTYSIMIVTPRNVYYKRFIIFK